MAIDDNMSDLEVLTLMRALGELTKERGRQVDEEGWTREHDDRHTENELSWAAASYIVSNLVNLEGSPPSKWPWHKKYWKPSTDHRRNLVKAGALIIAEIERIDRIEQE